MRLLRQSLGMVLLFMPASLLAIEKPEEQFCPSETLIQWAQDPQLAISTLSRWVQSNARNLLRPYTFQQSLREFDRETFTVTRKKNFSYENPIRSVENFMEQPELLDELLSGDLQYAIFKNRGEQLRSDKDLSIPIYEQIFLDVLRCTEGLQILQNEEMLLNSKSFHANPKGFVLEIFRVMQSTFDSNGLDLTRTKQLQLIHEALASRTQTFSVEAIEYILENLAHPEKKSSLAIRGKKIGHTIRIVEQAVEATTRIEFELFNVEDPSEIFHSPISVERTLKFDIHNHDFDYKDEQFTVYKGRLL